MGAGWARCRTDVIDEEGVERVSLAATSVTWRSAGLAGGSDALAAAGSREIALGAAEVGSPGRGSPAVATADSFCQHGPIEL